jgi:hypothetical protein
MRFLLPILCSLLLAGCPKSGTLKGSGDIAPAPHGYTVGCQENPDAVMCPKKVGETAK